MLSQTNTTYLIAGGSPVISNLVTALQSDHPELNLAPLPNLDDLFPDLNNPASEIPHRPFPALRPATDDSILVILHSSGSSGMPRSVPFHWEGILKNILNQREFSRS